MYGDLTEPSPAADRDADRIAEMGESMAWIWTDDLAGLLIDDAGFDPAACSSWIRRPVAYALPDDADLLEAAMRLWETEVAGSAEAA